MGRFEEGMGEPALWGGCWEWGAVIRKDSADSKMILTRSCPHRAGQHPGMGEAARSHHQDQGTPRSVWVGSGVGVPTLPSSPTCQAPIDPLHHPNHHQWPKNRPAPPTANPVLSRELQPWH